MFDKIKNVQLCSFQLKKSEKKTMKKHRGLSGPGGWGLGLWSWGGEVGGTQAI